MTRDQALKLERGDILYHLENRNADGTPQRWRVNGQVRTWKRDKNRIEVPLKHGMYAFAILTPQDFGQFATSEDDVAKQAKQG